jgi:hypothetical protein
MARALVSLGLLVPVDPVPETPVVFLDSDKILCGGGSGVVGVFLCAYPRRCHPTSYRFVADALAVASNMTASSSSGSANVSPSSLGGAGEPVLPVLAIEEPSWTRRLALSVLAGRRDDPVAQYFAAHLRL